MKEGAHINRSLLALGNCINALSEKGGSRAQYVNFRDSKLTRLLKVLLGTTGRTFQGDLRCCHPCNVPARACCEGT